jgi:hypothetical protein
MHPDALIVQDPMLLSSGGVMFKGGGRRRRPAHVGRLTMWERLAFAGVFLLMIVFIVVVTVTAVRSR